MAKKMNDEEMLEAMEQAVKMHFMAFQQFMKQTGGDIGLSLQLTTSYMAAMLKGSQEQNEKEEKLLKLLLPSGGKQSDELKGGIDMALLNGFKETETEQQYRRGEIYYINNASKEHIGSEMKKDRPAVIVSCDANNKHSDVLEVVFLTSAPKKDLPTHVTIRSTGRKSEALCEQPTPVSVERINNFVGKASEKEMEQIDIALLIGLGIKLAGAENQSGGASRKSEQQIQSSVKDRSKEESEKMAEENQMLREELKKQQESTIRSEAECSAYKAMHEQLLKKLMERRE